MTSSSDSPLPKVGDIASATRAIRSFSERVNSEVPLCGGGADGYGRHMARRLAQARKDPRIGVMIRG